MSKKSVKKKIPLIIIFVFFLMMVLPFILVVDASLQEEWLIKTGDFRLVPTKLTLDNYVDLLTGKSGATGFLNNLINSLKVGLGVCALSMAVAILGAYGLSRYNFKGKKLLSQALLFMYVFPTILTIYPIYSTLAKVGLVDSHLGLVLVHTTLVAPFCTWLLRSFFDAIPIEIEDAARVDGAGRLKTVTHILMPLAAPGILAAGMYALIYSWGEYMFSSIIITSGTKKTIPLALMGYMSHTDQKWGRLLAGCSLNFLPLIILFIPLLKNFLKGFMTGAVKS